VHVAHEVQSQLLLVVGEGIDAALHQGPTY
jgi:hypothetical protein